MNFICAFKINANPVYVGNTYKPTYRIWAHYSLTSKNIALTNFLINYFLQSGDIPEFEIMDAVDERSESYHIEKKFIIAFSKRFKLFNKAHNINQIIICDNNPGLIRISHKKRNEIESLICGQIKNIKQQIEHHERNNHYRVL